MSRGPYRWLRRTAVAVRRAAGRGPGALVLLAGLGGASLVAGSSSAPLAAQETHLVVVAGLGGGERYTEAFTSWALELRRAAVERYGVEPANVTVLAENPDADPALAGESRRDDVEAALRALASRAGPEDRALVVFIGHGSTRNDEARINLPGPDLTAMGLAPSSTPSPCRIWRW